MMQSNQSILDNSLDVIVDVSAMSKMGMFYCYNSVLLLMMMMILLLVVLYLPLSWLLFSVLTYPYCLLLLIRMMILILMTLDEVWYVMYGSS